MINISIIVIILTATACIRHRVQSPGHPPALTSPKPIYVHNKCIAKGVYMNSPNNRQSSILNESEFPFSSTDLPLWDHECPGVSHLKLKRLIQQIMSEAMRLPDLFNLSGVPPRPEEHVPFFDPKKYEQLVATAVLNKVKGRNPGQH